MVYKYNSDDETWSVLPECPHMSFTLAVINHLLTAVGGWQSISTLTNKLISFKEKPESKARWKEELPPMPTKRSHIAIAQQGKSLVAAGGYANGKRLATVEIMDTETHQWLTAASLPHPFSNASITFSRDRMYHVWRLRPQRCNQFHPHMFSSGTTQVLPTALSRDAAQKGIGFSQKHT